MAEYDEDVPNEQAGLPPQPLLEWEAEQPPELADWAADATTQLNNYIQGRRAAETSANAGRMFAQQVGTITGNFAEMVAEDPAALPVARELVRSALGVLVGTAPGATEEQYTAITLDAEREIARSAVTALAARNKEAAHQVLGEVSDLLPEAEVRSFASYINVMDQARQIDAAADERRNREETIRGIDDLAWGYLVPLVGKDGITLPPSWAQRVMSDEILPPPVKAALFDVYGRLASNGDVPASDARVVSGIVADIAAGEAPPMGAILARAGDDLRLADALQLAGYTRAEQAQVNALKATIEAAERTIATPANGEAGRRAFDRFVGWLLPRVREGASLDPRSPDYLLGGTTMQQFAPTGDDYVIGHSNFWTGDTADRPSLEDIFGRGKPQGDRVIPTPRRRYPPVPMPQPNPPGRAPAAENI